MGLPQLPINSSNRAVDGSLEIDLEIEEAKCHDDDNWLIQLLSIRRDANAVIAELDEH